MTVEPETIEQMRATAPTHRDWLGLIGGEPVGFASCSVPSRMGIEETRTASSALLVVPAARHQGIGGALYQRVSDYARELGRSELEMISFADDPDGEGFAVKHGFTVVSRAPSHN